MVKPRQSESTWTSECQIRAIVGLSRVSLYYYSNIVTVSWDMVRLERTSD